MKQKYILLTFFFSVLLCSCEDFFESTIELEIPEYEEQLVVSALFNNNYEKRMLVTKTVGINDDARFSRINDARIKITSGSGLEFIADSLVTNPNFSNYNYTFDEELEFIPEESYSLEVISSDGKMANCTAVMPATPELISATYKEGGGTTLDGDKLDAIDLVFRDIPDVENFYRIRLINGIGATNSINLESNDPGAEESADYRQLLLNDIQFDGEEYRLQILYYRNPGSVDEYVVEFSSISEDQYRFDKLLNSFNENEDNPFSTAAQLHTNIEGGLGLFAIENAVQKVVN